MNRVYSLACIVVLFFPSLIASQTTTRHIREPLTINPDAALKMVTYWKPIEPDGDAHLETTVKVVVIVGRKGQVERLRIISGHPMAYGRVLEALKGWKFNAYFLNGQPMALRFHLYVRIRPHQMTTLDDIRKSTAQRGKSI